MKNGWGKLTTGAQGDRGMSDKSDTLAPKWTACGLMRDHVVKTGLAKLVWDVVRCVEGNKCVGILEANETLLKAEMALNGGIRVGHATATHRSRRGIYALGTYLF